jgi:hypothetical protein
MDPLKNKSLLRRRLVAAYRNAWAAAHRSRSDQYRVIDPQKNKTGPTQPEPVRSEVVHRMAAGLKECLRNAPDSIDRAGSLLGPLKSYARRVLSSSDSAAALTRTLLAGRKKRASRQDSPSVDQFGLVKTEP